MKTQNQNKKGIIFAVTSAAIFGFMPLMTMIMFKRGINELSATFYRFFYASFFFYFLAVHENKGKLSLNRIEFRKLCILSFFFVLTPILLFSSYKKIDSSMATVLHFTYPICILLIHSLIYRSKISLIEYVCTFTATYGIFLMADIHDVSNVTGIINALLSAVTYSIYSVYLEKELKNMPPYKLCFFMVCFSAIIAFVISVFTNKLVVINDIKFTAYCIFYSLSLTVFGVMFYQKGVTYIGSRKTSMLSTLEPTVSAVVGIALLHEIPSCRTFIAILLIIISSMSVIIKTHGTE